MEHLPDVYQHFERAFPQVHSAHQDPRESLLRGRPPRRADGPARQARNRLGAQAEGAVRSHTRRALTEGESREQVRHVGLLALTTIGFPHTVAGLSWIEEVIEAAK
jgi:4-carboxymuconolactone decarboxylase